MTGESRPRHTAGTDLRLRPFRSADEAQARVPRRIEGAGGVLEDVPVVAGEPVRRYWIV